MKIMHSQGPINYKTFPDDNATRAADMTEQAFCNEKLVLKATQDKIMHTRGPTICKTFQAINKLFYEHLECLSVIKAC